MKNTKRRGIIFIILFGIGSIIGHVSKYGFSAAGMVFEIAFWGLLIYVVLWHDKKYGNINNMEKENN